MLLFANKARAALTGSVTSAAGQVATVTTGAGALFVGVGGVATSTANPMRCVITAVDASGNDTGAFEVVEVVRSGDNLTLQSRGLEGTSAAAWSAGAIIECRPTAQGVIELPRTLFQGVGQQNVVTNAVATSLLPGGTPLVVPKELLVVGARLDLYARYAHRGGTAQAAFFDITVNGTSIINFFGDSATSKGYRVRMEVSIVTSTLQSIEWDALRGDGNRAGAPAETTVNTGTTDLSLDIIARFGTTTTETLSLDNYALALRYPRP